MNSIIKTVKRIVMPAICGCLIFTLLANPSTTSAAPFWVCSIGGGNGFRVQANTCTQNLSTEACDCTGSVSGFLTTGCNVCISGWSVCVPSIPPTLCTSTAIIYDCLAININNGEACVCATGTTILWSAPPTTSSNPC